MSRWSLMIKLSSELTIMYRARVELSMNVICEVRSKKLVVFAFHSVILSYASLSQVRVGMRDEAF